MNKTTCKGRNKRQNPKVCFGWTQEWTSPRRIGKNKRLSVHEIVRGPFSSPKLIRTWPYVLCSPDKQSKTVSDDCCPVRRGIPDAWREYLACRGLCGTAEITVLRKNLIHSCVRSVATDRLWNQVGLPLIQGIPDPWKSKPTRHYNSNKCLRQRQLRNKSSCLRTGCVYDGDDEAEIERGAEHQFNKKYLSRERQKESKLTERETLSRDRKMEKDKDKKGNPVIIKDEKRRVPSNKIAVPSQSRKNKGVNVGRVEDNKVIDLKPAISRTSKTTNLHAGLPLLPKKRDGGPGVKRKKIQTDVVRKMSVIAQTVPTVKPRIEKIPDPVPRKNLGTNTSNQNACCNCLLQNYMTYLSGFSDRLKNPANHVLCKDCENAYYEEHQSKLPVRTAGGFSPDPKTRPTIYEWTKLKFCDCVQKARDRFGTEAPLSDRCNVKPRGTFVSKEEMKLTCYCCDSPYLRIQNVHAKTHRRKKCTCKKKQRRTEQDKPKDARERRRNISCSAKHCGTCSKSKTHAFKSDVEPLKVVFERNTVHEIHRSEEHVDLSNLGLQRIFENVRQEDKKENSRVDGNVETDDPSLCEVDSNIMILYRITDSGEEADVSEYTSTNINGPLQITRVSSLTLVQKVRNAALNKLCNQLESNQSIDSSSDLDEYVYICSSNG